MDYFELDKLRAQMAGASGIWQFDLLKPHQLASFVKDRGIAIQDGATIEQLWRCGLLRADKVLTQAPLDMSGLQFVQQDGDVFVWSDARPVSHLDGGYGGVFQTAEEGPEFELWFHPFRLLVVYHISRVFKGIDTASTQFLIHPPGLAKLAASNTDHLDKWTGTKECAERFEYWNRLAEFAVACEPSTYAQIFNTMRWRHPDDEDSIETKISMHRESVNAVLANVTTQEINRFRNSVVIDAETMDANKTLHVLLRLMSARERLKLRGRIGASMMLLSMAETIRRAAEVAHKQDYPEEDELGFGQWMDGARKSIYGTERIADAAPEVRRDFLTNMGLDSGLKARVYVEGETEFDAMTSAAGDAGGVEFINLRGQVIEKKQLAFIASLKADMKAAVFSAILLDGDSLDNVRALKKAAKDKAIFGRFFIAQPDFEFANFTAAELLEVVRDLAQEQGISMPPDAALSEVLAAKSNGEFFAKLSAAGVSQIQKGSSWGKALMKYALQKRTFPAEHPLAGDTRPAIEAAQFIINARTSGYQRASDMYELDSDTGQLTDKKASSA